ncbi:MAG TPA: ubiquinone/menaquinone biosynthesis methyltransferase [Gemmatimonadales bacterium]|nr:ubiquinone/menaquinone biosynthesis methyltransferase [Gemmatimonadales bacterium]
MFASDRKLPVAGGREKREYVRGMFDAIAPTYDRLNRIISLRLDLRWRRVAVAALEWERAPAGHYLDLCAGTMDFGATLEGRAGFRGRIAAADFSQQMLEAGRGKGRRLAPVNADALELPFPNAVFEGAMVGWGVRNLMDLDAGLAETARVLKPGARLVVLEMSTPGWQPLRGLYLFYFHRILPIIGRLVSKHTTAYTWLPESARVFPEPTAFARRLEAAGFRDVRWRPFMGGVTTLHVATRR